MIEKLRLIRNVGQFDSVDAGAQLPLTRFVLIYAENGRGKTTLAAIFRSLASGERLHVEERRRLSSQHEPHVIIDCSGGSSAAMFQNGAWSRSLPDLLIFDDAFVDANLYSGLTIEPEHRQRLHELVLGARGVDLHRNVQQLAKKIEEHNGELRTRAAALPAADMYGYSADEFCALQPIPDVDTAIQATERKIAAIREQEPIRKAQLFDRLALPAFDIAALATLLARDLASLDTAAAKQVQLHLDELGRDGEAWLSTGVKLASSSKSGACPFCLQALGSSRIIDHYRAYFSSEYDALKRSVATSLAEVLRHHGGDVPAAFERTLRVAVERRAFWARFCELPSISLDSAEIVRTWREARDAIVAELQAKQAAPLEVRTLPDSVVELIRAYEVRRRDVELLDERLQEANAAIRLVKEQAASGSSSALESDLARLKATRARQSPKTAELCKLYLEEQSSKAATVAKREEARAALEKYRTNVFPAYQQAVNEYLGRFNAAFRIDSIASVNTRGGTVCNYNVIVDSKPVPVAGGSPQAGAASFRNTLSAGDRSTLALAFFFASLDNDPGLATKTIVIDDPITSLDEHRSLTTVQEIRRLAKRAGQVIVLSHDKRFLSRIWDGIPDRERADCTTIEIVRSGEGSTLAAWNVTDEIVTEYDRRHALLREYLGGDQSKRRDVAEAIRPVLEHYMRVARPEHFRPGDLLGPFLGICEQRLSTSAPIFDAATISELRDILEYANRFHHDTNPAWETVTISDAELLGFVTRTLRFVCR